MKFVSAILLITVTLSFGTGYAGQMTGGARPSSSGTYQESHVGLKISPLLIFTPGGLDLISAKILKDIYVPSEVHRPTTSSKVLRRDITDIISDLHFVQKEHRGGKLITTYEFWYKKPNYVRFSTGDTTTIRNGEQMLRLNHRNRFAESKAWEPSWFVSMFDSSMSYISSIYNKQVPQDIVNFAVRSGTLVSGSDLELSLLKEASDAEKLVYACDVNGWSNKFLVDANTGLLLKTFTSMRQGRLSRILEWTFDYSDVPVEKFSLSIPAGYDELGEALFEGMIYDSEGKPVADADIYLLGARGWTWAKGKSDSEGHFDFGLSRDKDQWWSASAMQYPIVVRAVSNDHPGYVAWTVIKGPGDDKQLPAVIPPCGDVVAKVEGDRLMGTCLGVSGVELVLEPGATITGFVLDTKNNEPIAKVAVGIAANINSRYGYLVDEIPGDGRSGCMEALTDEEGFYVLENIPSYAWPADYVEDIKSLPRGGISRSSVGMCVVSGANGYVNDDHYFTLEPGDVLTDRRLDFSFSRASLTVRGHAINNYGEPLVGYKVHYCYYTKEGKIRGGEEKLTDPNGEFELTGCAYEESLFVRLDGDYKYGDWDKNDLTRGKEYVYYVDKDVPVVLENDVNEYYVEVIAEKPELTVEFEVKDTSGQPVVGVPIQISGTGGKMSPSWAKKLGGSTDQDGKYAVSGFPNIEKFDLSVKPNFPRSKDPEMELLRESLSEYQYYSEDVELPGETQGYTFEVILIKKRERRTGYTRLKIYNSNGELINSYN